MSNTILLTGATDGIGFETAKLLAADGHELLLHGRNQAKLDDVKQALLALNPHVKIKTYTADLSDLSQVVAMAKKIQAEVPSLDVLLNNAGVFKIPDTTTVYGLDARFVVNTFAPYVLTKMLSGLFSSTSRVVNLSSAAQAPVDLDALKGKKPLSDSAAYAQSKLAITMWTIQLALFANESAPSMIAVNPASFLGSKMVKQAYGSEGKDLSIGATILQRAATGEDFNGITGRYFDNDIGAWSQPHPDALSPEKNITLVQTMDQILTQLDIQL